MPTFTYIQKTTLSGIATSITLNNIPQTYDDLCLIGNLRSSNTENTVTISFNGNSQSSGITYRALYGSSGGGGGLGSTGWFLIGTSISASPANTFAPMKIYLPNYTNTSQNKSGIGWGGNGSVSTSRFASAGTILWSSTNAITSITIFQPTQNFEANSFLSLYGISRA